MTGLGRFAKGVQAKAEQGRRRLLRGVLRRLKQGKMTYFQADGRHGETFNNGEFGQHFGFASRPHPGAECWILTIGGDDSHALTLADADRDHPCPVELEYGDACLYNSEGDYVHVKADRTIEVSAEEKITIRSNAEIAFSAPQISLHSPSIDHYDSELD